MTPARLQRIEEIFYAALDQDPDHINAFLETTCEGDEVVRRKVEVLLASRQRVGGFIETSAAGIATRIIGTGQADLLVGQTFGHYKILKRIGIGGMGEVYLATDIVAGRKAALKLLPMRFTGDAERLKRFRQEAHAVVALNHPNILTVYEIGEDHSTHYIASELIEGETLRQRLTRGRMELSEAIDVAIQVASALAAAHEAGIVHRDINPGNIMLRPDGYVKVLDFGIAKLAEQEAPARMPQDEALLLVETNLGSILGTVPYMSPEQACGAPVDKRTDIWSLGLVLYEMVTGHAPFTGNTAREVMTSILEKEPSRLTSYIRHTPAEVQRIVTKALRKNRTERYQSANEILQALKNLRHKLELKAALSWLRWARSPIAGVVALLLFAIALALPLYRHRNPETSVAQDKSIAVLPFENLSRDPDNAYFAHGIQQEILTRLAEIADLKVISRTSTQRYQSKPGNLSQIAKQLGVANILEGSVQKVADQVRVNVQLLDGQTDSHLWAETYDRKLTDIFSVESEIAKGIAESLQAKLTSREEQALAIKPTNNPEAYDAYLRGLAFEARSDFDALGKAIGSYEQAVELDPNFALGWARLSRGHGLLYFREAGEITASRRDAAKSALDTAQKLQPNSRETLLALGYYQFWVLRDYGLAKTTFKRVQKMLPGSSDALVGLAAVSRREGHWDESVAYWEQALALDPRNVELLVHAASTRTELRQFQAALKLYDRALDIVPNEPNLMASKAGIYQAEGNLEQAAKFLSQINAQTPSPIALGIKMTQLRLERNYAEVIRLLQARQARPPSASETIKAITQVELALHQRVASDTAGAKVAAEQARNTLEQLCKNQPDNPDFVALLSLAYAALGEKDSAFKEAERAITLLPSAKDRVYGPSLEEILAVIQTMSGANSQAISTLTRLLQMPYYGGFYFETPVTPALLGLDPLWDPLRGDPRFEKLVEEAKQPIALEPIEERAPEKSIAVLPFENLGNDKEDASFADGIQDDILTKLAKISDLKVISRTSVTQYRGERDLHQIRDALRVSHVLEGSVRKTGAWLHINAQLVDARTDTHIWAEQYDRDLKEMFAVQSEIAQKVAERLHANISPAEKLAIERPPTTDLIAFDLYTRAKSFLLNVSFTPATKADLLGAAELLNQAVAHDRTFFQAYCQLAWTHDYLYSRGFDRTPARLSAAEAAIQAAFRLRPNSGEAHLARAEHLHDGYRDYDGALAELEVAGKTLPNDARVFGLKGNIERRAGRWQESTRDLEIAVDLDPRNTFWLNQASISYAYLRRHADETAVLDRALAIEPDNVGLKVARAEVEADQKADTRPLHQLIDELRVKNPGAILSVAQSWLNCALAEHDPVAAENALTALGEKSVGNATVRYSRNFVEGRIARMTKDDGKAYSAFTAAHVEQEKLLGGNSDDAGALCVLGLIDAALGRKEDALRAAQRAVELIPLEKDAIDGMRMIVCSARIAAWVGDTDLACEQLSRASRLPSGITYGELKLNPFWDPLRGDPCFEQIVASLAPK
jgi:eukaryotic-like serine/threonine-protein kinase